MKEELILPAKIESVDTAASKAEELARRAGFGDEALFAIDMAMREAVANAVKHGSAGDETKNVEVSFVESDKGFEITVRDFGKGFDVEEVPDPTNPENLLKASGRGILFMRTFMEEIDWKRHPQGGMTVKMVKLK